MSATSAPFGFRPVYHPTGLDRAKRYPVASGAAAMFKGMMVTLNTNGTVVPAAAAADFLGVAAGFEFIDAQGKPNLQPNWPAAQVTQGAQNGWAWVYDDIDTVYEVQASGSIAVTAIGDQADVVNVASGNTATGLSTSGLSATLAGVGVQAQWRIRGFGLQPDNQAGDAYTIVQVSMARQQFVANKTAI